MFTQFMKDWLWLYFKGLAMGAADLVPGVSGGTIALIVGIYGRLIVALSRINILSPWRTVEWQFFLPLGAGIISAILLGSNLIHGALTYYRGETYAFFLGLIAVSAWLVWRTIDRGAPHAYVALAAALTGAVFAYLFVGLNPLNGDHSLLTIFLSGMVAIMAMMLPGVSGSFLLLFLGQYEFILDAVRSLAWPVLLVFGLGCASGVLVFSRLLHYVMEHHRHVTLSFLVGMMVGSLRLPYREIVAANTSFISLAVAAGLGVACVWVLSVVARKFGAD